MSTDPGKNEQLHSSGEDQLSRDDNRPLDVDDSRAMNDLRLAPRDAVRLGAFEIVQVVLIGLAQAAIIVATGLLVRAAMDTLERDGLVSGHFLTLIAVLAVVVLIGGLVRGLEWSVSESIGFRYMHRIRMVMYAHLERMSGRRLLNISRGAVLLRFTGDLGLIRAWVSRGIARGIVAGISIAAGTAVLFYFHFALGLLALGVIAVAAAISLRVGRWQRRAIRMVRRRRANLTTNLTEQIHGMLTVQALGRLAGEYDRLQRQSARLTRRLVRYAWVRGLLRAIATGASSLAMVGVLAVGAYYFAAGQVTLGTVVAAMMVARMMMRPVRSLGMANEYWQNGRVSRQKVVTFLRQPYREADGVELPKLRVRKGLIEFRNVSLVGALHGINARVEPRQLVAIMGPSGAGKSSLLSVVARITDPDEGDVAVDGQSLSGCSLRSCARQISMMSNELPLLRGSLRRNLLYRWREAPDSELERVIKLCGVEEVIAGLPDGLSAGIKEGGANLSAGYAARIALARAMVGNPKILLLDEPTLNLDDATRRIVLEAVLHYGGTVLLVTREPEEAALADVVWEMEDGRIERTIPGDSFRASVGGQTVLPAWARGGSR